MKQISNDIVLDIRYATKNNFTQRVIYDRPACYVHQDLVEPLKKVVAQLAHHQLRLKVYDCYRPLEAQFMLWEVMPDERYVANPFTTGSNHNRGTAIDATLINSDGNEIAMPTPYDTFSEEAHTTYVDLPQRVLENRTLFHTILQAQGLIPLPTEWWHFDFGKQEDYPIINATFETLIQENVILNRPIN